MFQAKEIILFTFFWQYAFCCTFSTELNRQSCTSMEQADAEGYQNWTNLFVFKSNNRPLIVLEENSFSTTPNLKELSIHGWLNEIQPGAFNVLSKLDKLTLFDNNLRNLTNSAFDNARMRVLIMKNNNMQKLPKGLFKNTSKLKMLTIDSDDIKVVTKGVFDGTRLVKVFLIRNGIEAIEEGAFANMKSLIVLSLTGNRLKSFNARSVLGDNNILDYLWLSGNLLSNITKDMLEGAPYLEFLLADLNKIESVEANAFSQLPNLKYLDLSNNLLVDLNPNIFSVTGMQKLMLLYLHNNRLTYLKLAVLARIPKLKYLSVGGNPFQCPCFAEVKNWVAEHKINHLCDDIYLRGDRPICINTKLNPDVCFYDIALSDELYVSFNETLAQYPALEVTCDTSKGAQAANLTKSEWVMNT